MSTTPKVIHKNRYELDQMADGFSAFIESFPSFNQTLLLDEWRETQYNRLDANGQIYLDYTGGGLYSDSQLSQHMELLRTSVLGNPHSANPTSLAMTDLVEGTRKYVLQCLVTLPASALCLFARRFFRR
jgi:selenocysteine lyase/cysteine desulfurase